MQDRAKERFVHTGVPNCSTFGSFEKIRTSCWIIEEKNGEFFCDCYEGSKGRLCKHSIGMMYFVGRLTAEEDVRSVPLGSKRKRGRPAKNRHCLTRSPTLHHVLPVQVQCDDEITAQSYDAQTVDDQLDDHAIDLPDADQSNDLLLHLESDSDEDVDILGAKYTYKPPKKKAKVSEVTNPSASSISRGRNKVRGGRGHAADRNDRLASISGSSRPTPPLPTSSVARGTRGRPRGSRVARHDRQGPGRHRASPGCMTPLSPSPPLRGSEASPETEQGRAVVTAGTSSSASPSHSSPSSPAVTGRRGRPRGTRMTRQGRRGRGSNHGSQGCTTPPTPPQAPRGSTRGRPRGSRRTRRN